MCELFIIYELRIKKCCTCARCRQYPLLQPWRTEGQGALNPTPHTVGGDTGAIAGLICLKSLSALINPKSSLRTSRIGASVPPYDLALGTIHALFDKLVYLVRPR